MLKKIFYKDTNYKKARVAVLISAGRFKGKTYQQE